MSATIERGPGLPPYRPRKAPEGTAVDGPDWRDSATYVLILRTHDVDGCQEWAERLYRDHTGDALALTGRQSWVHWLIEGSDVPVTWATLLRHAGPEGVRVLKDGDPDA